MPNWTFNILKVTDETQLDKKSLEKDGSKDEKASRKELKKFVEENILKKKTYDKDGNVNVEIDEEYELTFQGSVPRPKSLDISSPARTDKEKKIAEDNLKKYGATDWYDWNIYNWGAKWDADSHSVEDDSECGEVHVYFHTAWSPPLEWLQRVSKRYPSLLFDMNVEEESNAFIGNPIARNGELCENITDINYPS